MSERIPVGVLGATGMVGQEFVSFLRDHPWFDLTFLAASDRSAGKTYREATTWRLGGETPAYVRDIVVSDSVPKDAPKLMFSAMDASVATEIEQAFATAGHMIVSNSRNHRMDADVPLLVPEANARSSGVCCPQQNARGWTGQIVTNPNCSTIVLVMALAPLKQFGIKKVIVTTMQAISGAGYPGVASLDIIGQRRPVHRRRGAEDGIGNAEDSGHVCRWEDRAAGRESQRERAIACRWWMATRCACRSSLRRSRRRHEIIAALNGFRGVPQQKNLAQRAAATRWFTWSRRIVRSRGAMWRGRTAWRCLSGV